MKYNWIFNSQSFECDNSIDSLTNVVIVIHWQYGNEEAVVNGSNAFPLPNEDDFTPFNELSYEQVSGWLQEANDMNMLDAAVDNEIAQKIAKANQEVLPPPF